YRPTSKEYIMSASPQMLGDLSREQITLLKDLGLPAQSRILEAAARRVALPGCRIALVGEHSRGKSALLNALARQNLFAVSPLALNTINVLRWGPDLSITAYRQGQARTLSLAELQASHSDETFYERVEVSLALELYEGDVELIEIPSMSQPLRDGVDDRADFL